MHAQKHVNCLECHQPAEGQTGRDHHGFVINTQVTAANCKTGHARVYEQFVRSRHAAPSWAAIYGARDFTAEQVAFRERFHPGACNRPPDALASLEGPTAIGPGCAKCHSVGKPNADGSIGTCTACHARHTASVELARLPTTCGQCHMGPAPRLFDNLVYGAPPLAPLLFPNLMLLALLGLWELRRHLPAGGAGG